MAVALPTTIQPDYAGLSRSTKTRILTNNFGDGYRQRAGDGLNMIMREYDIEWTGSDTNINELVTHFEEREGYQDFTWTPPDDDTEYKWTCEEWSRTQVDSNISKLTAHFRQEFDL